MRHVLVAGLAAMSLVTATVTARTQPAGPFAVQLMDNTSGMKVTWKRQIWPDQNRCDEALGNLPAIFRSIANPDPADVPANPSDGTDPELADALLRAGVAYVQGHHSAPNWSLSCELQGDPA